MNLKHISIFNLIEIFRGRRQSSYKKLNKKTHCEQKYLQDFYCIVDKPYIKTSFD